MTIKVYKPIKNVNFTHTEVNRPSFHVIGGGTVQEEKEKFKKEHFDLDIVVADKIMEYGTLEAKVNLNIENNDFEHYRNCNYILVNLDGVDKFYFITSVKIANEGTITYSLRLDTITTYLDTCISGSFSLNRGHIKYTNDILQSVPIEKVSTPYINSSLKIDVVEKYKQRVQKADTIWYRENGGVVYALFKPKNDAKLTTTFGAYISYNHEGIGAAPVRFMGDSIQNNSVVNSAYNLLFKQTASVQNTTILPFPLDITNDTTPDVNEVYGVPHTGDSGSNINRLQVVKESLYTKQEEVVLDNPFKCKDKIIKYTNTHLQYQDNIPTDFMTVLASTKAVIRHYTGDEKELHPLALYDGTEKMNLKIGQSIDASGGIVFIKPDLNFSDKGIFGQGYSSKLWPIHIVQNRAIFSNGYDTYITNNSSQLDNAKSQAKYQGRIGAMSHGLGAITKGVVGGMTFNPILVGAAAQDAVAAASSLRNAQFKVKAIDAKLRDVGEVPTDLIMSGSWASFRETLVNNFGDSGFTYDIYTSGPVMIKALNDLYYKFGYELHKNINAPDYTHLKTHELFSFIKSDNFNEALDKSKLPVEVVEDIATYFRGGVRLWAWKTTTPVDITNGPITVKGDYYNVIGKYGMYRDVKFTYSDGRPEESKNDYIPVAINRILEDN